VNFPSPSLPMSVPWLVALPCTADVPQAEHLQENCAPGRTAPTYPVQWAWRQRTRALAVVRSTNDPTMAREPGRDEPLRRGATKS